MNQLKRIENKEQMLELLNKGVFGNTVRNWNSPGEIPDDYTGKVMVRNKKVLGFPVLVKDKNFFWSDPDLFFELCHLWEADSLYYTEQVPDDKRVIQGELMLNPEYCLYYSKQPLKLRDALNKDGKHVFGLQALCLLKACLTPSSLEDIQDILENTEMGTVIEFTTLSCNNIGWSQGRNTIIWEVRNY